MNSPPTACCCCWMVYIFMKLDNISYPKKDDIFKIKTQEVRSLFFPFSLKISQEKKERQKNVNLLPTLYIYELYSFEYLYIPKALSANENYITETLARAELCMARSAVDNPRGASTVNEFFFPSFIRSFKHSEVYNMEM